MSDNRIRTRDDLKSANLKADLKRQNELKDVRAVMSTVEGRRLLWRMIGDARIFSGSVFTGNSHTFYNEGRREFMVPYFGDIMAACPELFWQAQRENAVEEK